MILHQYIARYIAQLPLYYADFVIFFDKEKLEHFFTIKYFLFQAVNFQFKFTQVIIKKLYSKQVQDTKKNRFKTS
jgi:hypothetical protein